MFMYRLGSSNGFLETIALLIVTIFSLVASHWTPSHMLTIWYVALGLLILNVTLHFNYAGRSIQAQNEIAALKALTESGAPHTINGVFAPYGTMWWLFRCVDLAMVLVLVGMATVRLAAIYL